VYNNNYYYYYYYGAVMLFGWEGNRRPGGK